MQDLTDPFELVEPNNRDAVKRYFNDVWLRLDRETDDEWKRIGPVDPPETIYHYTTPGGFLGIVEHQCIFLTDAFFLNDHSELIYARDLAIGVLERKKSAASGAVAEFLRIAIKKFDPFNDETGFRYYVASFCTDGNLLSQWRAYGAPGSGVALGFASGPLRERRFAGDVPHVVLHRMEYCPENQRRLMEFVTNRVCELMMRDYTRAKSQFARDLIMSGYYAALMVQMIGLFPQFKHPMFEEEQEWRLSTPRTPDEYKERIKFRVSGKNIVPYIVLDLRVSTPEHDSQMPLNHVRHAPTAEPDLRKRSVETFLRENGYARTSVEGSGIPLREA